MSSIAGCSSSSSSPSSIVIQQEAEQHKIPDEQEEPTNQPKNSNEILPSNEIPQQKQTQPVAFPQHLASPLIPVRQCRICLLSTESRRRPLLSPCRCAGSVQHVHVHCLAHWIEVSSRKLGPPPHCELCGFRYRKRPFIDFTCIHFPFMNLRDRVLNSLCLLLFIIMGLCAWVAIQHLQQAERRPQTLSRSSVSPASNRASRVTLSQPDLTVLVACILMFAALFLAIFTQYRAEVSLFHVISRLWTTNRNWRIRNYFTERENNGKRRRRKLGNENNAVGIGTTTSMMTNFFRGKS